MKGVPSRTPSLPRGFRRRSWALCGRFWASREALLRKLQKRGSFTCFHSQRLKRELRSAPWSEGSSSSAPSTHESPPKAVPWPQEGMQGLDLLILPACDSTGELFCKEAAPLGPKSSTPMPFLQRLWFFSFRDLMVISSKAPWTSLRVPTHFLSWEFFRSVDALQRVHQAGHASHGGDTRAWCQDPASGILGFTAVSCEQALTRSRFRCLCRQRARG